MLEKWELAWRHTVETPNIDPVAASAEDSDADPRAVRRAIENHVKSPNLRTQKDKEHVNTSDAPTSTSPILKSLKTGGTNKAPIIDFGGDVFLSGKEDNRGWLRKVLIILTTLPSPFIFIASSYGRSSPLKVIMEKSLNQAVFVPSYSKDSLVSARRSRRWRETLKQGLKVSSPPPGRLSAL